MNDETWPALKWVFAFTPIWEATVIIIPLISAVVFVLCLASWRRAKAVSCQPRTFLLAALIMLTATLVEVSASAYYYFRSASIYAGRPSIWLCPEKAIADMLLCRTSARFAIGIVATAFCLALALLLPREGKETKTPSSAEKDATTWGTVLAFCTPVAVVVLRWILSYRMWLIALVPLSLLCGSLAWALRQRFENARDVGSTK